MGSSVLLCEQCRGTASVAGVRCRACDGGGAFATWGDRVLAWSTPVDRRAVRGRRIARIVRAACTAGIGTLGIAALGAPFASGALTSLRGVWTGLVVAPDATGALAWLGVLFVLAATTLVARAGADRYTTAPRLPADADAPLAQPSSVPPVAGRTAIARAFAPDALRALEEGAALAERLTHGVVLPAHLFAGLASTPSGSTVFGRLGVASDALRERIERVLARQQTFAQAVTLAPATLDVLFGAYVHAARDRRPSVTPLDLLIVLSSSDETIRAILDDLGIPHEHLVNVATWVRVREEVHAQYRRYARRAALRPRGGMNRAMTAIATPILDVFGEDLTQLAASGHVGPFVGRTREFRELFRIIESGRRGVILVGERGVGKSAIVEAVATRMTGEDVPARIQDKRLVRLSVERITSGVEHAIAQERLLRALSEAARSGNVVLVVEQLEHLLGAGGDSTASVHLGDVLANVLEQSGMVLIGTSTPEAYQQHIERSALGNLLERIPIGEPEGDEAIQILEVRSILIEAQQRVFFSYAAIAAVAEMGSRFLHDRAMPEKAAVLMEEVAVAVRNARGEGQVVGREDVAHVIEEKTGIPASSVAADEAARLLTLEDRLHERVIGQDEAVRAVSAAIRRARVELREGTRPIATLLFLGPTGVGKTELAKTVAATYFGSEEAMVRLDMSEFQEPVSIERLIGGGTAGGGQLTEAVRRAPFSLVLLDEFEKAHPDILNVFLQVFDDGRLTDSAGHTVDFTQTIIIATSNAGTSFIQDAVAQGMAMDALKRELMERTLRTTFRPELLNRFDGVIVFTPLTMADVTAIAMILLAKVAQQLEEKGIHLRVTDAAIAELAAAGFDPQYGARPLRRVIQERVQDALAERLLTEGVGRRDTVVFDAGGRVTVEKAPEL